jgi:hypothetical protein
VAALFNAGNDARFRRMRRVGAIVAGVAAALWLLAIASLDSLPVGSSRAVVRGFGVAMLFLALIAFVLAVNSTARAERRSGALAGRIWRSQFTIWFFRLAGIGLGERSPTRRASAPTADDATLPDGVLARHPSLPRLLHDGAELVRALADRSADIERVLVESGATRAEGPAGGATTRAELDSRRLALIAELRTSLEEVRTRRADVVAATENVRIQLARLRAGLAKPTDLDPDVNELQALLATPAARLAPPRAPSLGVATPA